MIVPVVSIIQTSSSALARDKNTQKKLQVQRRREALAEDWCSCFPAYLIVQRGALAV